MKATHTAETSNRQLSRILEKAEIETPLSSGEIALLLHLKSPAQLNLLFKTARHLRQKYFQNKIFLYGFIYTSTFCRNDCRFCYYRRSNTRSRRYRKTTPQIVSTAVRLAESGVHLIDLTMGEDPLLFQKDVVAGDRLCDLVSSVSGATGLPVMVSPGRVPERILKRLKISGAAWYACYQETHTQHLFDRLRPGQDFSRRLKMKSIAHRLGLLVEEGVLCGVGENTSDMVRSIEAMRALDADQVRVMKFVPQQGTPMANHASADTWSDSLIIGVLRLVFPHRLIPASLDLDGIAGLKNRLDAGANVVTSIVPPGQGLAGVARHSLDIEDGNRTCSVVSESLNQWGLAAASRDAYLEWIDSRRPAAAPEPDRKMRCNS
jgi:methylornithine synthase